MCLLYDIAIYLYALLVRVAAPFNGKARLMVRGHKRILKRLAEAMEERGAENGTESACAARRAARSPQPAAAGSIIWFHAASLGEFEQGRPLIEAVRAQHPEYKILLTFFSPSGYEIRKDYAGADWVFYLPLDTPRAARCFVKTVKPQIAIFIKYEFWINLLAALRRAHVRTFLVSAIFRPRSVFFRWYGGIYRKALGTFETIFVQKGDSLALLASIGVHNVVEAGDTRFDRVADIAAAARPMEIVERFRGGSRLLVAGSTWPEDEELLGRLLEQFPEMKMVIVPHEIDTARVERLVASLPVPAVRYSQVAPDGDPTAARPQVPPTGGSESAHATERSTIDLAAARVLVVDTIGLLSSIYRYAWVAYIGGGFGVGIHNTLEAAVYGIPVAFGPNYEKFREAVQMVAEGCAVSVASADELGRWIGSLYDDRQAYERLCRLASAYVASNRGATGAIMQIIDGNVKK